jgi:hypothetical protein
VLLSAEAFDPDGDVARVEFFVDDVKFGEIDAPPYQLIVSNLPPNFWGSYHYASARAVDASGDAGYFAQVAFSVSAPDLYLFGPQGDWNYLDDDADPGPAWRDGPNSAQWSSGIAPIALGFDGRTIINGGPTNARHATIYFWRDVSFEDPLAVGSATMYLLSELADGVIVYVNGVEVLRRNLPLGPIAHTNHTGLAPSGPGYIRTELPPGLLDPQFNVIAVEMHQNLPDSAKLLFDLALVGTEEPPDLSLGYGIDAAGLHLGWDSDYWGEGWLEMAEDLAGPWTEAISGSAGYYVQESIHVNGRQRFYRLRK